MGSDPAHKTSTRHMSRGTVVLTVALAVVVLALLAGGIVLATRPTGTGSASATTPPQVVPLDVVGTTPAANATNIAPSTAVTVALSTPLAADSPMPTISPSLAGNWSALSPTELQFVSTGPLVPGSQETITVPGGPNGLVSTQGQHLAASVSVPFTVAQGSTLRLQQLLAQLGYLPLSFTPATQPSSPQQEADPQQGTFNWRWPDQPELADLVVGPRLLQHHHQGRHHELRGPARPDHRRAGRTPGLGCGCWRRPNRVRLTPTATTTSTCRGPPSPNR